MNRRSHLKGLLWIVPMAATQALPSAAQQSATPPPASEGTAAAQSSDLQKQLDQLKQLYDATTRDLQQRIAALEQQIQKQKEVSEETKRGTANAVELAAHQAAEKAVRGGSAQVGAKYQGQIPSEPTYDLLNEAEASISKMQEQLG